MLFPPFRYQSALAQTQVSLFPCSHADGFTEKSSQKFLLKHRFEDCLCTTQNCHMHFFFQLLSHFPAFKNYHLPTHEHLNILLKLFASDRVNDWSTMVLSMDSQEVPQGNHTFPMTLAFISVCFWTAPSEAAELRNKNKNETKNQHHFWVRKE